ncbi:MAG: hypothetical protein QOJ14_1688 [Thermoleophilaceae bacterium]|nr:hypothetical protein [Thermoleophilaceae bacterium]
MPRDRDVTVHVTCSVQPTSVPHAAVALHSLLARAGDERVAVHCLHPPGLPDELADPLGAMVEDRGGGIAFVEVPDELVEGLTEADGTRVMWYRLFMPDLLPQLDRVIHLDSDAVVTDSLAPLWATELGDRHLAAVTNVFQADHAHHPGRLGLPANAYFNDGVLVMNLAAMRRDASSATLREYGVTHPDLPWVDQDVLNAVLWESRVELHPRWNCMNSFFVFPWSAEIFGADVVEEARRRPAVRHFEGPGPNKPWHYMCERPMRELYFEHRRHTPWPTVRLDGATPANRARRLVRAARRGGPARTGA